MVGMLTVMLVASLIISPGWHLGLLQSDKVVGLSYTFDASGAVEVTRYRTTLMDWLAVYGVAGNPAYIIYAIMTLAGIAALAFVIIKSETAIELLAFALLINYALIPYALFYDYPSLVITIFFINRLFSRRFLSWAGALMNGAIMVCLFIGDKIPYRYWIVIVLALSTVILWVADNKRRSNQLSMASK